MLDPQRTKLQGGIVTDPGDEESHPNDDEPKHYRYRSLPPDPQASADDDGGLPSTFNVVNTGPQLVRPLPETTPSDPEDWQTFVLAELEDTSPPSRAKRMTNHIAFYVVVLSLVPATLWFAYLKVTPDLQKVYLWPAIVATVFGLITGVLRKIRGSVIDAERDMRILLGNDKKNGITPSYRLARKLHSDDDEVVGWESKLHPISIFIGGFSRMQSKGRRIFALAVIIGVVVQATRTHNAAWYLLLLAGLGLYSWYLYIEWSRDTYALTRTRIMAVTGIVESNLATMPTAQITDFGSVAPWHSNLLAWLRWINLPYTFWDLESPGQEQRIKHIYFVPAGDVVAAVFGLG